MGGRPERWSSSIPGKRRCSLSANYKFQLTISPSSSLAWSRFRWTMTRSLDGKSRLQPVDIRIITHPSILSIRQLTTQRAYKDLRPKSTMCSEIFHSFLFLRLLFGIRDPGDAGLELLGRRRLCSAFRTRRTHEKPPTDRPARLASP